ncbi:MAG: acyl-CoA dehydrogenase family protein [Acidimicrobiales bacterium]
MAQTDVKNLGASEADVLRIGNARATETEQLRHLHPDVVDVLVRSGVLRRWVAEELGGESAPVTDVLGSIERTSKADGATGWSVMIANTTALLSHRLPEQWASTIFGDPGACTGGYGMPAGTARLVDGGVEVSGRWSWGSGTDHCTWIGGGVRVVDDSGAPTKTGDGCSAPFVFFDLDQVELLDTWHVAGLKGTASTDYAVDKAFVPEGRWAQFGGREPRLDGPLSRFPFFGALAAGTAAVTIGLAERAIDELVLLGEKKSAGSSRGLAERAPTQADLALAQANVAQARSFLYTTTDRVWEDGRYGRDVSDEIRAELRLAATSAALRCVEAVRLCYHAAGGAAVYEKSPLQRVFRDAEVAQSHGMIAPRTMEPLGRLAFGLETNTALF